MNKDEILEFPYTGVIKRIVEGHGDDDDTEVVIYEGIMDEHMVTDDEGRVLQTSSYIISIPLTKDKTDAYIIPRANDRITLTRYGETLEFTVDNSEPSQIGGISIYATRKSWE